jgi:exodeoxyribonuclease VII large subunit
MPTERRISPRRILSVSQLTRDIKIILENSLPEVWVQAEISNLRIPSSGHIYFTLKDSHAQIRAVFFKEQNRQLKFELKDGMNILVFGRVGVYEKAGDYQIIVLAVEPQGLGALNLALQQLKEKLLKEGLFAAEHKKPIPRFIRHLGIITSPTGAVIHDMFNVLKRRSMKIDVTLFSVPVQGETAAPEISKAIKLANKFTEFDCLVIARGGGSLEDLWSFNDEELARTIYNSRIPVVSAVGHEIDWTICDLVADMRAPTPSAAIEMIILSRDELRDKIQDLNRRLYKSLEDLLPEYEQRLDDSAISLERAIKNILEVKNLELKALSDKLMALSPLNVLARGYSITFDKLSGKVIKDAEEVAVGSELRSVLAKGNLESRVSKQVS